MFYLRFQKCTKGYIWSLYVHYVYLLIYQLSVVRSFIFFNIRYEYNITLRLDSSIFFLDNDLFIGSCCVVLESSGLFNLHVHYVFDRLLNSVSLIHNYTDGHCNIILSGDFNRRTSDCSDCIDCDLDNDLLLLPDDYVFDISRPRFHRIKAIPIVTVLLC